MPAAAKTAAVTAPKVKKGDHVFLVDGSGYIFRAYHALPPLTRKSDGLQVNAVLGFCNMLWKLLRDMKPEDKPTHLAVVFDKSEHTFRNEMYKDYKAHRPDAPSDLIPQFPLIREAVRAFDIPCLEMAGFEADDLIATYAREASEAGAICSIVSSDKDLMQLVTDRVMLYDTMKDKKIGRAEVIEKFGVPPEKVIEVQSLIGDSSDNVPGVPGIGVKTAAQLIGEYGDLETLLKRAGEIKQEKRRQALIDNAELARISKKLVTLDDKVKLEVPLADLVVHEPDYKHLIAFLKAMEFATLTRRVAEFGEIEAGEIEADSKLTAGSARSLTDRPPPDTGAGTTAKSAKAPAAPVAATANGGLGTPQMLSAKLLEAARNSKVDRSQYETVRTAERLKHWIDLAYETGVVALDTQTTSTDPMVADLCGFSLGIGPNEACYVPLSHKQGGEAGGAGLFGGAIVADQLSERDALKLIKPLLEDASMMKVAQNVKFDLQIFALRGINVAPCDDVMLMSYVLDAGRSAHGTDSLSERFLNHRTLEYGQLVGSGKSQICFD
ncbi:MAG TPA: 5'-3' exonuclease H3TH domain-containing protein, partial [Xanthobacteraceae bacterium]|nr:5'-3' exonuclease H3TH domain-containing protein [Xanthobacteraceae bacterium]